MKKTIVVINQKGGVGKSTTAQALGAGLHIKGKRVLFIDLDGQGNLTDTLNISPKKTTLMELLTKKTSSENIKKEIKNIIVKRDGGDVIPFSAALAGADMSVVGVGKEMRLKEILASFQDGYDYVIIDTPPALGILTVNALTAADGAIIPAQADAYSLHGISQMYDTIEAVREYTNPKLKILGIVLTRYNNRAVLAREVAENMEEVAEKLGTKLFKSKIRECVALREAQASRTDIFSYAPKSNAAKDYDALIDEIVKEVR